MAKKLEIEELEVATEEVVAEEVAVVLEDTIVGDEAYTTTIYGTKVRKVENLCTSLQTPTTKE